jgi:hypothetical protein
LPFEVPLADEEPAAAAPLAEMSAAPVPSVEEPDAPLADDPEAPPAEEPLFAPEVPEVSEDLPVADDELLEEWEADECLVEELEEDSPLLAARSAELSPGGRSAADRPVVERSAVEWLVERSKENTSVLGLFAELLLREVLEEDPEAGVAPISNAMEFQSVRPGAL